MSWFLKQKDTLTALNSDMSEETVHKSVFRKCGVKLEHAIRSRYIEPFSTEDYIKAMEDIITTSQIGRNWYKPQRKIETSGKPISRPNKPQETETLKSHKCGITSHLANNCPKTRVNEIEIEKTEVAK
ncbi:hypothetical protein O181_094469 [Austropuccinia psidii MF-1]|uniref:Uncharacterized protein n=1 Tax=Austropuccinia psidii MF-1 TaxID=1389203 RepID=A0A9Q3J3G7_9BASI|nr:hypothetical protein [Austropuccinia psidii MF-1]